MDDVRTGVYGKQYGENTDAEKEVGIKPPQVTTVGDRLSGGLEMATMPIHT